MRRVEIRKLYFIHFLFYLGISSCLVKIVLNDYLDDI